MKKPEDIIEDLEEQVETYEDYSEFLQKLGPLEKSYVFLSNYMNNAGFSIKGWKIYNNWMDGYHWGNIIKLTGIEKEKGEEYVGVLAIIQVSPGQESEHFINISLTDRPTLPVGFKELPMPASWDLKS